MVPVVHPAGWNRWISVGISTGGHPTGGLTPGVFFWGTPRVGQGFHRWGPLQGSTPGPARAGNLLVWTAPPAGGVNSNPLVGWLVRVGHLLGYL